MLDAGLPLVAFLQLVRVYGQALAHIADAEVKLFHLYVHEPMIRDGAPVLEIAEELSDLASELLPLSGPIMDAVHQRWLHHFLEHGRRSGISSWSPTRRSWGACGWRSRSPTSPATRG